LVPECVVFHVVPNDRATEQGLLSRGGCHWVPVVIVQMNDMDLRHKR
jgi:hypothetical protein